MEKKEITFDKFIRGALIVGGCVAAWMAIHYLSAVLLPFALAWFFAYLLYPVVRFIERILHIRIRAISIIITLLLTSAIIGGVLMTIIPPMIEQFKMIGEVASNYLQTKTNIESLPDDIEEWIYQYQDEIEEFFSSEDFISAVKSTAPGVVNFVGQTFTFIENVITTFIIFLYMFFILLDYEMLSTKWVKIFPEKNRPFWQSLATEVEHALSRYIRGQGTVAFIMGILFCIGLSIIDFPMAIGLGILIGIMDMVPYLHTFALIPAAMLSLLKAAETGENFWIIFGSVFAVFCIVQVIIEAIVTPKVMGKAMGLNPAILLLSLSVWGALLGFIGLIIALPATTIIMVYWKRYVTHEELRKDNNEKTIPTTATSATAGGECKE